MADARDSKSRPGNRVPVQVRAPAVDDTVLISPCIVPHSSSSAGGGAGVSGPGGASAEPSAGRSRHCSAYLHHLAHPRSIFGLRTSLLHEGHTRTGSSFQNSISPEQNRHVTKKMSSGFQNCMFCPGQRGGVMVTLQCQEDGSTAPLWSRAGFGTALAQHPGH